MENMHEIRTLAEWAQRMGYRDPKYFGFKYRKYYGQNGKLAMVFMRLNQAKKLLLRDAHLKHYEIAQMIGLKDEVSLYKYFMRHAGKSPSAFKDMPPVKIEYIDQVRLSDQNYGSIYSRFKSNALLSNRFLVHQYTLTNRPTNPEAPFESEIISYIIDTVDDNEMYISRALPLFLDVNRNTAIIKPKEEYIYNIITFDIK